MGGSQIYVYGRLRQTYPNETDTEILKHASSTSTLQQHFRGKSTHKLSSILSTLSRSQFCSHILSLSLLFLLSLSYAHTHHQSISYLLKLLSPIQHVSSHILSLFLSLSFFSLSLTLSSRSYFVPQGFTLPKHWSFSISRYEFPL